MSMLISMMMILNKKIPTQDGGQLGWDFFIGYSENAGAFS